MTYDRPDIPQSVQLSSFELIARDINEVDIELLHALTISVRWPHRQKDWAFLRQVGQGFAAVDQIGRVFGSAMWFPQGKDFATIGLVITTPRAQAQGGGRWLMEQLLARCGKSNLALNATHAAYPLYVSLGFRSEGVVNMRQGEVQATLPDLPDISGEIAELPPGRVAELFALDARAFGHDRSEMLAAFAEQSSILALWRGREIVGYSMCREFGRGHQVGPVVAFDSADAAHLTAAHLGSLRGRFARVDTREKDGLFADFLERCGLQIAETVTTMSKGRPFLNDQTGEPRVFGLAGHAVG